MTDGPALPGLVRVVFVDANVLYSRVLRDYLLYAADEKCRCGVERGSP